MDFIFDPESHSYKLSGVALPSVTGILQYHGLIPAYPAGPYRVRGRNVHLATHAWDLDHSVEFEQLGAEIAGYLESYKLAMPGSGFVWCGMEESGYHPTLCYAGTLDRRGWRHGVPCIADLKSGDTGRETGLQLAGYVLQALCCPLAPKDQWLVEAKRIGQYGIKRYKIRLFADGSKGKITEYSDPLDLDAWVGYVNTMRHELQGKKGT